MQIVWEILREDVKKEKDYNILDDLFVGECFVLWAFLRHENQSRKCSRIQWLPPKLTVPETLLCRLCWIRTSEREIYFDLDGGSLKSKTILVVFFLLLLVGGFFVLFFFVFLVGFWWVFFAFMHHQTHAHSLSKYINIRGL